MKWHTIDGHIENYTRPYNEDPLALQARPYIIRGKFARTGTFAIPRFLHIRAESAVRHLILWSSEYCVSVFCVTEKHVREGKSQGWKEGCIWWRKKRVRAHVSPRLIVGLCSWKNLYSTFAWVHVINLNGNWAVCVCVFFLLKKFDFEIDLIRLLNCAFDVFRVYWILTSDLCLM